MEIKMKRFKNIIITAIVASTIGFSGLAVAQGWGGMNRGGNMGYNQQQRFAGPGMLLRDDMYKSRVEVLAELSGQSQETIQSKLKQKPMWAVIDEYKVDFKAFQTKMHDKVGELVSQAVSDGKITREQADSINQRRSQGLESNSMGRGNRGQGRNSGKGRGRGMGRGQGNGMGNGSNGTWN